MNVGGSTIGLITFEPGWRWSECVKPVVGTESCQAPHTGYIISGRLHVVTDDDTEGEVGRATPAGSPRALDACVVGGEPYVGLDFTGAADYAKR